MPGLHSTLPLSSVLSPCILILTNSFAPRQGSYPDSQWGRWQGAAEPNTERRQTRDHGSGQTRDHGRTQTRDHSSGQVPERYLTKKPLCFIAKFNLIRILSHLIRSRSLLSPSQTVTFSQTPERVKEKAEEMAGSRRKK